MQDYKWSFSLPFNTPNCQLQEIKTSSFTTLSSLLLSEQAADDNLGGWSPIHGVPGPSLSIQHFLSLCQTGDSHGYRTLTRVKPVTQQYSHNPI